LEAAAFVTAHTHAGSKHQSVPKGRRRAKPQSKSASKARSKR
jgi:hypothetical protein